MDKLINPNDVAEMLSVKKQTVWKWIRDRKLPALVVGGQYRIRESDLENFIKEV